MQRTNITSVVCIWSGEQPEGEMVGKYVAPNIYTYNIMLFPEKKILHMTIKLQCSITETK